MRHWIWKRSIPLLLAAALCGCGASSAESGVPAPSPAAEAAEELQAALAEELIIESGISVSDMTVLADGSLYLVGQEEGGDFCVFLSTDEGDSWRRETPDWATESLLSLRLDASGRLLALRPQPDAGLALVSARQGGPLTSIPLTALGELDGISSVYPIDGETLTVTGERYGSYTDAAGESRPTVHPMPFEDLVLRMDGALVARWGDGIAGSGCGYFASDGEKLYYLEYASNALCSLDAAGKQETLGRLGQISGASFCRGGVYYYVDDQGIAAYDTVVGRQSRLITDPLASYLQPGVFAVNLCVTDKNAFVVYTPENEDSQKLCRYPLP